MVAAVLLWVGPWSIFATLPGWREHHEVPLVLCCADSNCNYFVGAGNIAAACQTGGEQKVFGNCFDCGFICAILLPATLIGGCANPEMSCNVLTYPCVYAISVVGIIVQAINAFTKNSQR